MRRPPRRRSAAAASRPNHGEAHAAEPQPKAPSSNDGERGGAGDTCMGPKCCGCVWCWHSGVPCPLRWPLRRHCSRTRAAAPSPQTSRVSSQSSEAAASHPAQRGAQNIFKRVRRSQLRLQRLRQRGQRRRRRGRRVGSAARLIFHSGRLGVGAEQQFHHLERRALGSGVVQG